MIRTKRQGLLIVVSGPSGSGKNTICDRVLSGNKKLWESVSMTTRKRRRNEEEGKDYFFVSKEEFEATIAEDGFLEYAVFAQHYYGTPKKKVQEKLDQGIDVLLIIEIQGALKIKELYDKAIFIFILPPSMETLKKRLLDRATEPEEVILERFSNAYHEINEMPKYNYVIVNDRVAKAADKLQAIITSERCRVDRIEEVYLNNPEEKIHESLLSEKEFANEQIQLDSH